MAKKLLNNQSLTQLVHSNVIDWFDTCICVKQE